MLNTVCCGTTLRGVIQHTDGRLMLLIALHMVTPRRLGELRVGSINVFCRWALALKKG